MTRVFRSVIGLVFLFILFLKIVFNCYQVIINCSQTVALVVRSSRTKESFTFFQLTSSILYLCRDQTGLTNKRLLRSLGSEESQPIYQLQYII